jgi:penicillin amidase
MKGTSLIKLVVFIAITFGFTFLFNSKIGDIPPLGKFLNPFTGFWQNAENIKNTTNQSLITSGLQDSVSILIDEQGIPHVFAENEHDLYFAQGYITAKDRLWQMDFQTRYAAGRLSEVVGEKAIELDRYQRRMGMVYGAEAMLKESLNDPKSKLIIEAYSEGVNAYIKELSPRDYPIEFKILDYKPEIWTSLNSALLLKLMSATLARGSNELAMNNILAQFGEDITNDLFPNYPFNEDPIIPAGTPWNFNQDDLKPPISPSPLIATIQNKGKNGKEFLLSSRLLTSTKEENIGSNNWAIAGNRSSTGFPLLANDPHLDLTLPSIWYQIQLHSPTINVYGVSIPGAPNVIIGFNENVAWGVTNVGSDVLDWYKIQFKDDTHHEYLYNDKWEKTSQRIEEIVIRGKESILDTVYYTHQGPVSYAKNQKPAEFNMVNNIPVDYALKWVAHLPSNELRTFYELNKAKNYEDYRKALVYFSAPAQNFVFADKQGDIAITSNGLFPLKEKRQGKFLLDGNDSTDQWINRIPVEENPTVKNPTRGYVSSANQWPVDQSYPYYLGWEFGSYERAHRINNQLETMNSASLESFKALQNDNYSILAENVLDTLVNIAKTNNGLNDTESKALTLLAEWDQLYEASSIAASLFETWYNTLNRMIWFDDFGGNDPLKRYPSRDRTVHLLLYEPTSHWFSNGAIKLTRDEVVLAAFKDAIKQLEKNNGDINNWEWSKVKKTHVPHLADIEGFGSKVLQVGGSRHSVNAVSESNGPSWRMIVQLGDKPKAFGIIPGGQSGNPGSKFYDNQITTWEKGELNELLFLENNSLEQKGIFRRIELKKIKQ